jgi:hypothetical protein
MNSKASEKQLNYLRHILESQKTDLELFTTKPFDELLHKDVTDIFAKVEIPINPHLENYKYIIDFEDTCLNYIIGKQLHTKRNMEMDLICFKDFMIIDWDLPENKTKDEFLTEIKEHLKLFPYTFYIYESFNGFHGYLMSKKFWFANWNTIKLLKQLNCDKFYIGFTRKVGFVVRLNKKSNRNEEFIEKFICKINDFPILPEFIKLIEIKDNLMFKNS